MQSSSVRVLDTLKKVSIFGTTNAADFPAGSIGAANFAKVTAAVTQASALGGTQRSGGAAAHSAAMDKAASPVLRGTSYAG